MPLYEFKCPKCNLKFERSLKITDDHSTIECLDCKTLSNKLPPKDVLGIKAASTSIPKDIDKLVGYDSDERWVEYDEKKRAKSKLRDDLGTSRLSKDPDGNYGPVEIIKDGKKVSEEESINLRKEMFSDFREIKKDPETKVVKLEE